MKPPPPIGTDTGAIALRGPSYLQQLERRGRLRRTLPLLGPAFVAAIAYVDPGNFATNIAGGAAHGYLLLWVILLANLIGMLVQNLSAKVGIATGRNLPELCREHLPAPASWSLWVQAELIAMATDLAEFIGAALALNLLFGVPLFVAGLMTAVVAFAILGLQQRGYRKFELAIAGLMGVILLGFVYDALHIDGNASAIASGFIPGFDGKDSVLLAVGILGATVMPHVIYLHSALTQDRIRPDNDAQARQLMRYTRLDVVIASIHRRHRMDRGFERAAIGLIQRRPHGGIDRVLGVGQRPGPEGPHFLAVRLEEDPLDEGRVVDRRHAEGRKRLGVSLGAGADRLLERLLARLVLLRL